MMTVFFLGTGGACVATGFAQGPLSMAIGLAGIGFFAAIYHPVGIAWITRNPKARGRALGINGVFGSLGTAGGAVVAGTLATWFGWQWAFFVPGAICIAFGLALLVAILMGAADDPREQARAAPLESSRGDMMRGGLVLLATIALSGLVYQSTSFAMPKLFDQRLDGVVDTAAGIGVLVSVVYGISAMAQLAGGWLADRYDPKRVYVVFWIMQVPFLLLAATLVGPVLLPVVAIMVLANTTLVPAENSLFARFTPPAWRGTAFGVKFLVSLGVSAASVPLVAEMFRFSGDFYIMLYVLAGFALTGGIAALALPARGATASAAQPAE